MALFRRTQEVWVDVEAEVTPEEFYNECDSKEIQELITILEEEGHLNSDRKVISLADEEWNELSNKLFNNHRSLTQEEEDVIRTILRRF